MPKRTITLLKTLLKNRMFCSYEDAIRKLADNKYFSCPFQILILRPRCEILPTVKFFSSVLSQERKSQGNSSYSKLWRISDDPLTEIGVRYRSLTLNSGLKILRNQPLTFCKISDEFDNLIKSFRVYKLSCYRWSRSNASITRW